MKEVFTAIQERIVDQVDAIRWVDFDLGQLDQQPMPPVSFPCALMGFTAGDYAPLAMNAEIGDITLEVVCAFRLRERTHSKAETSYRDEALEHMDTVDAVRIALTGLSGSTFNGLKHTGTAQDRRSDLRVWRLRFSCTHYPQPPECPEVAWPGPDPVEFCVHPEIT